MGIEFEEYDSISDLLLYLNDSLTLNFVVRLSRKNKSGERIFYQYETRNGTDKYGSPLRSIKRTMTFYFVIQNRNVFGNSIVLRPQDVEMLNMLIQQRVLPWFFDNKNQAFRIKEGNLLINKIEPVTYFQTEGRYITFEPVLVYLDDKASRGIRVSLWCGDSADMGIDAFMGMVSILKTDMYTAACVICNYAKTPPYGINVYNPIGLGAAPTKDPVPPPKFGKNSFLDNAKRKE